LTQAFVCTVQEIEPHNVVSSGTFADEFRNYGPQWWTKQALPTLQDGTEVYIVDIIASVSDGSNPPELFRVGVGTVTGMLEQALLHKTPDSCNWAGFITKNPAVQHHNFASK
jgi:hypothetical protein